jgi:hypothetical protein
MKLFYFLSSLLLATFLCTSCDKEPIAIPGDQMLLRIENATDQDFSEIIAYGYSFGLIKSGKTTSYEAFDWIYAWPQVTLKYEGTEESWTSPIDNIGFWNQRIEEGLYTLRIDAVGLVGLTPIEITFIPE